MAWVTRAQLTVLGDASAAALLSNSTSLTRAALRQIIDALIAAAIASSQTVKDAAVLAMQDAAVLARLSWSKPALPNANFDTYYLDTQSGFHYFSAGGSSGMTGLPAGTSGRAGAILVMGSSARVATQWYLPYGYFGTPIMTRSIVNITDNSWTPWAPLGGSGGGESTTVGSEPQHMIRRALFVHAMGGPISTGGKAAVALRLDHGFANLSTKVLPALTARGIKPAVAYNPRRWHLPENAGVTASTLNGWVAAGSVEIMNHSATHTPADTEAALYEQIVTGLAEIEAELPAAAGKVWGFAPPGVSSGDYMGFNEGRTPAGWDTYAGRLILRHHAVATGYLTGTAQRVLDGTPRDGLSHITIDGMTVAALKTAIDAAIVAKQGLQLMLHPSQLDTAGNLTTAQFTEVLDYIVAKRTAGDLVTLSPYEMLLADSTGVGDTGWRDISASVTGRTTGALRIKRVGSTVWLDFDELAATTQGNDWLTWASIIPAGFRAPRAWTYAPLAPRSTEHAAGPMRVNASGALLVYGAHTERRMLGTVSWTTSEPWPTTLPGVPA